MLNESYFRVLQEEGPRKSIAQVVLVKSTDFMRRIITPVQEQGRVTLSYVCPHCHRFLLEDYISWVSAEHSGSGKEKNERNWRCAACGGQCN